MINLCNKLVPMSELLKYIDLTSLSGDDTTESIEKLCRQAVEKSAAVCVSPHLLKPAKNIFPLMFPSRLLSVVPPRSGTTGGKRA